MDDVWTRARAPDCTAAEPSSRSPSSSSSSSSFQCKEMRAELASCLMQTDCVQSGKSGDDCLRNHFDDLPKDCKAVYNSYVHCRRGLLDMRKRFRGNAPSTVAGNPAPGGTTTVPSSLSPSLDEQARQPPTDPATGLSPDRAA